MPPIIPNASPRRKPPIEGMLNTENVIMSVPQSKFSFCLLLSISELIKITVPLTIPIARNTQT